LDGYLKLLLEGREPGKLTVYICLYSIIMYIIQSSLFTIVLGCPVILRKVYGRVNEQEVWRIRTNQELVGLETTPDMVADIKRKRFE
jgi:hypothetical protein